MTELVRVPVPSLSEVQLVEIAANFTSQLPVTETPGGPAIGWVRGITTRMGTMTVQVEWLDGFPARPIEQVQVDPHGVAVETGEGRGATAIGFIAAKHNPLSALASRMPPHLTTFPGWDDPSNDDPQETPMDFQERILHRAALGIQTKRGCTYPEALQLARDAAKRPLPARPPLALDPPMPIMAGEPGEARSSGSVLSHADALTHLEAHMRGFDALSHDDKHRAAVTLCGLMNQGSQRKLLSAKPANGKPTALTCLYPGATKFQRLRSYLAATVHGWADLGHAEQHKRTLAARGEFNLIDAAA